MRILSALAAVCSALLANATVYYVSPSGSDSNNGTSTSSPWKTIDRVNQSTYTYLPGDQILFLRGSTFRGQITMGSSGTAAAPIKLGAYGTGNNPIISGCALVSTWTQYQGNIWKATVSSRVDQVYIGGARMTLARYPNTGWLRNTQGGGTQLNSTGLTQANGYWNGARAVIRSSSSSFDTVVVSNYANGTLTFTTSVNNMGTDPWGFFLYKKMTELDAAGEWFYDPTTSQLYVWAPNNANPNTLTVEASVYWAGVLCAWQRHYQSVENLTFQNQQNAGIRNDGADHVSVTGCTFTDLYHGIRSYGSYDNYSNNTFQNTLATGALIIDDNTTFAGNTMTNIALVPGEGESAWGYFGVRTIGAGNIVRGNRLDNIGYTGLEVNGNALVEKNVIKRALANLNDGGGIAFDNADGMIIQDNIVQDIIGNYDGSAATTIPHNQHMGNGIYFGNTSIKNTTVQRNTVSGCPSAGINVDHTMLSTGYQIKDNVLFNNAIQMIVSDYSNYNGPGAVAPYHVANFNDVYSGNVMYSLTKDQLCMKHFNCYSAEATDFGTFTNNKYFNPYNEMSILVHNLYSGGPKYFALERWKIDKNEDAGSTRSPLRQSAFSTTSELSSNMVVNGNFDSNVTGWTGWPTNAQVSRVTTNLDNGALKAYLPNNSVYPSFTLRNPDYYSVVSGQWYRMKFSIQSSACGDLIAGLKGQSQLNNPYTIWQQQVPFDTERRDLELYFQSTMTDQALVQFVNQWTEPLYYIDNVQVHKVSVSAIDPSTLHKLFVNDQATAQSFTLPSGCWSDVGGTITNGSITLQPYTSRVMYKMPDNTCSAQQTSAGYISVKMILGGAYNATTGLMRDDLRVANYIPASEPYSAMGITVENPGAAMTASLAQVTGAQALVDWVVVELRNNDANYTVVGRRSALLRRDGTVITSDGNTVIPFNVTAQGRFVVVRHRNHAGAMLSTAVAANGQLMDFTLVANATYGTDAEQIQNGVKMLYPGNVNGDASIKFTGSGNDRDPILVAIGSVVPTNRVLGYRNEDVNLDGSVMYTGSGNDRDVLLVTIGDVPTLPRVQQMP